MVPQVAEPFGDVMAERQGGGSLDPETPAHAEQGDSRRRVEQGGHPERCSGAGADQESGGGSSQEVVADGLRGDELAVGVAEPFPRHGHRHHRLRRGVGEDLPGAEQQGSGQQCGQGEHPQPGRQDQCGQDCDPGPRGQDQDPPPVVPVGECARVQGEQQPGESGRRADERDEQR
ncbi:hypothetical protein GCM10010156_57540 [Planobispora rosea]|uniref:Uncharacterized protein n=1 Tax=Planobispora rosea TaxID=35762 RepID=A0A8J3S6W8_PLARO|nr:hypothetical protein GCM10010156_57540 [Planobispora rosea]GIH87057.1 hypothetical protein Pro02_54650 [Planobispora rosea]